MKMGRYIRLFGMAILIVALLGGCFGGDDAEKTDGTGNSNDSQTTSGNNDQPENESDTDNTETTDENDEAEKEEDDASGDENSKGVAPKSASEQVSFTQVTWFFGSPKRQTEPGVWYYTAEDHPANLEDTFDWEEEDVLLWQIGDEKYGGYSADTEKLEIVDENLIKIVVSFDEDGPDESNPDRMPRNYISVEKGALDGKSFYVETVDGEELSLE
ncbi:hypothetical protein [Lentibacillus saliphilus]|uniref:hypothetical protein n=1 Tax=Lentibacillus saliphilus TaxID=2737028 RepID=UPI001C3025E3|nr:hypothetical protein [Lentibacillus saliphilus]